MARSRFSQNRWAQRLGLDSGHLSQLVNGKRLYPNSQTRRKLLEGLDLEFEDLFEIEFQRRVRKRIGNSRRPVVRNSARRFVSVAAAGTDPVQGVTRMPPFRQEVLQAIRSVKANPAFSLVVVLTLALGIGANTAIFSVVNSVLLQPLSYPSPDRLVRVWSSYPERQNRFGTVSPADLGDWRENSRFFEAIAGYPSLTVSGMVLTGDAAPQELTVSYVTEGFFETLATDAAQGRYLIEEDQREGQNQVLVLSDGVWKRLFGSNPGIVGRELSLNNKAFRVIGIMPPEFEFPSPEIEMWAPVSLIPDSGIPRRRNIRWMSIVARLKEGASIEQARDDLTSVARQLSVDFPRMNEGLTAVSVRGLHEHLVGDVQKQMFLILGAVSFVLLIGCANVANLFLAQSQKRYREISVRLALGASRLHIVRQQLTECLILAITSGTIGILLGWLGIRILVAMAPEDIPRVSLVAIDGTVLLFTAGVSVLTGLAFGVIPALRSARFNLNDSLKEAGRTLGVSRAERWYRQSLVAAQLALVVLLTIGAGLLIGSYSRLLGVDPGFRADSLLTMQVTAPGYKLNSSAEYLNYFHSVLDRVRVLPGVREAAFVRPLPLGPGTFSGENWTLKAKPTADSQEIEVRTSVRFISTDYFRTMGIPLLEGRDIDGRDRERGQPVAIVNENLADIVWPGSEDRSQKELLMGSHSIRVVGVAGNIRQTELAEEPSPVVYWPIFQNTRAGMTLVVRGETDAFALIKSVQNRIWELNPDQPITQIASMDQLISTSVAQYRFSVLMMGLFAAVALILAAVGIYGVLSYLVTRRTREIGIRMTLGAQFTNVMKLVIGQGMAPAAIGIAAGLAAAVGMTGLMSSMLFEINATDPAIFGTASGLLLVVAFLACYIPARRACRVDPQEALRYE